MVSEEQWEIYSDFLGLAADRVPGFQVRYKSEEWTSKVIGALAFFNPRYMTDYTTTRYPRVYYPSRDFVAACPWRAVKIGSHELVHLVDQRDHRVAFPTGYISPQIAAAASAAAVGAIWQPWMLTALGALGFAAPWPSPWRARAELRAYAMSMAINFWRYGSILSETREWIVGHLTGWPYYKSMWSVTRARVAVAKAEAWIVMGSLFDNQFEDGSTEPYRLVHKFLQEHGLLMA